MEDFRSDVVSDTSVDKQIRARYSLDLKSVTGSLPVVEGPPSVQIVKGPGGKIYSVLASPEQPSSKKKRRISVADAARKHHAEMPLVMLREIARGHSGAYQWRRGAIFVSYPPTEQKALERLRSLINQECYCHGKAPWRLLELFGTSTYAAGPQTYGDITILLACLATYNPDQLYIFSHPEDMHVLDYNKHQHNFELPSEPFTLPLKCLYAVHHRSVLAKLLPWFRVPIDTMAIYMDVLEVVPRIVDDDRVLDMRTIHKWIADLLRRCANSESFKEVQRVQVKVKQRGDDWKVDASKSILSTEKGPRSRYVVKTRILHKDGRGSSWSFSLETYCPEDGVIFVTKLLDVFRSLGPVGTIIVPKLQWTAEDSPILVALSSLSLSS